MQCPEACMRVPGLVLLSNKSVYSPGTLASNTTDALGTCRKPLLAAFLAFRGILTALQRALQKKFSLDLAKIEIVWFFCFAKTGNYRGYRS